MLLKQADTTATMAEENYSFLKTDVIKSIRSSQQTPGNFMEILLRRYLYAVNSTRTMSRLRTSGNIAEFFTVLESRDCLSPSDVSVLVDIANLWRCSDAVASINWYKRQFNLLENPACTVCGNDENQATKTVAPIPQPNPAAPSVIEHRCVGEQRDRSQGVDEAIERISMRLGRSWKNLARTPEFGFSEYDIDALEDDHRRMADQIRNMFREWREKHGKKATLPRLIKALIRARRKDLADLLDDADDL